MSLGYCTSQNYKKEDLEVLFYYQSEKGKLEKSLKLIWTKYLRLKI